MNLEQVNLNADIREESPIGEGIIHIGGARQGPELLQDYPNMVISNGRVPGQLVLGQGHGHSQIHPHPHTVQVGQMAQIGQAGPGLDSSLVRMARGGTTTTSSSSGNSVENFVNQLSDEGGQGLIIETTTWSRDSHELFDYEAQHINNKRFLVSKSSKIFRQNTECSIVGDEEELPAQGDYLLSIKTTPDGKFVAFPADRSLGACSDRQLTPKKVWLIVRDLPGKSYALQQNDMVKLGRFKLRVKQLVRTGDQIPELRLDEMETTVIEPTLDESLTMQCRICLTEGEQEDDPLLCPCQCRGSIKFVHLECLRHWINGRLNLANESGPGDTFFFRQLQCELCKSPLPSSASIKGSRVNIVRVPQARPPFIVLENIYGNVHRGVHVVSMAEKKDLKLGRGHESDVRISDVSISRYHATIRYRNDNFMLEDHDSKFGTLVSVRRPQAIENSHNLALQVGRTVVNLRLSEEPCSPDVGIKELPMDDSPEFRLDPDQTRGGNLGGGGSGSSNPSPSVNLNSNQQGAGGGVVGGGGAMAAAPANPNPSSQSSAGVVGGRSSSSSSDAAFLYIEAESSVICQKDDITGKERENWLISQFLHPDPSIQSFLLSSDSVSDVISAQSHLLQEINPRSLRLLTFEKNLEEPAELTEKALENKESGTDEMLRGACVGGFVAPYKGPDHFLYCSQSLSSFRDASHPGLL
ncbi:putative zinc finger protein [Cryptosporidium felis]|nr:putative zinc finger protein [Cryptosporidium felis]